MVLLTTLATPGGEPLGLAEMNPFLNTPSSTVSSSTISSLPTTVTSAPKFNLSAPPAFAFSDYSDSLPSAPCAINRSSSTGSHASYASSAGLSSAIERFARTPPPRLRMDDLMSASSSVCGTPVVAPETLAIPVVCEGLSLVGLTNPDDEDEVEVISLPQTIPDEPEDYDPEEDGMTLEEAACHRRTHKRRQTLQNMMWSISGESNSVDMQIDDTPLPHLHLSRPSRDVGDLDDLDFEDDVLFNVVDPSSVDDDASSIVIHGNGVLDPDAEEIEVYTPNTNYEPTLSGDIDELDSPVLTTANHIPDYISPTDESFRRALVTTDVGFESDSVEIVYLDKEAYSDYGEYTPRTTASEEMRRKRRENYDKTFRYDQGYPPMECYLMKHYMSMVHEHMLTQPPSPIFRSLSFDDDANSRPYTDYEEDDESERFSEPPNDISLHLDTLVLHR